MPVDHTSITVPLNKYAAYTSFLLAAMEPLGLKVIMEFKEAHSIGLGESLPYYWIVGKDLSDEEEAVAMKILKGQHPAFAAESEEQVQRFHAAALKAGATDNGAPGPRPQYGPNYYAAFVTDPIFGMNLEVVCRKQ